MYSVYDISCNVNYNNLKELLYLEKWKIQLMITLLLFTLVFAGCGGVNSTQEVASVGEEKITAQEFTFFLYTVKSQMEMQANEQEVSRFWDTEEAIDAARQKALEEVVKFKVQLQKAKELGIELTEQEEQQIQEQRQSYISNLGGRDNYNEQLAEMGLNDKGFMELLENSKIVEKLFTKVSSEGTEYNISKEQIKDYYEQNKEMFKIQPTALTKHILLSIIDDNRQPLPEEQQQQAKEKAKEVYARLQEGEDFDALMHAYSGDPGLESNPDGYEVMRGIGFAPAFEEAAFTLEVGEFSEIIETEFGYHIIKVESREEYYQLDEYVQVFIEEQLIRNQYEKQVKEWKQELPPVVSNQEVLRKIQ